MSNMHSSSTMINPTLILTIDYREEAALIVDPLPVPHSSEVLWSTVDHTGCQKKLTWVTLPWSPFHKLIRIKSHKNDLIRVLCRSTIRQIDLICGTPYHGLSASSFRYRFQTITSANWKCWNRLAHQSWPVYLVSLEWIWSATRCHPFSLDHLSCPGRTSKNCISSVVIVTSSWNYHHYVTWMWSVVSMHYIVVRRFQWTFNRSSLCSVHGTLHTLRETGLHFALCALYLVYDHCVCFSTICICLQITQAARSLLRQRCGSSISPSRFGGADTSLLLISKQHSSDVIRLLTNYDARSWHCQEMRNLSVRRKKTAVDWLCGANSDMKFQHRHSDLVGNNRFVFSLMIDSWINITIFISSRRQVKGKHHHALSYLTTSHPHPHPHSLSHFKRRNSDFCWMRESSLAFFQPCENIVDVMILAMAWSWTTISQISC